VKFFGVDAFKGHQANFTSGLFTGVFLAFWLSWLFFKKTNKMTSRTRSGSGGSGVSSSASSSAAAPPPLRTATTKTQQPLLAEWAKKLASVSILRSSTDPAALVLFCEQLFEAVRLMIQIQDMGLDSPFILPGETFNLDGHMLLEVVPPIGRALFLTVELKDSSGNRRLYVPSKPLRSQLSNAEIIEWVNAPRLSGINKLIQITKDTSLDKQKNCQLDELLDPGARLSYGCSSGPFRG